MYKKLLLLCALYYLISTPFLAAQVQDWKIPQPYPKPDNILSEFFLEENVSFDTKLHAYTQYADYMIGCYQNTSHSKRLVQISIATSEAVIENADKLLELSSENEDELKSSKLANAERIRKDKLELESLDQISKSLVAHIKLVIDALSENYSTVVSNDVAQKGYSEVVIKWRANKAFKDYPLCPGKVMKQLPLDKWVPFEQK